MRPALRRPRTRLAPLLLGAATLGLLSPACRGPARTAPDPAPAPAARAWDVAHGGFLEWDRLVERLAGHRYVLLGELHDSPVHHRLQARLLRALAAAGRRPAVVLEMLSTDDARALAAATAAPDATAEDVRRAVDWDASGWPPFPLYAPVFEAALEAGLPLAAGDLGGHDLAALRREGVAGLAPARRDALGLAGPATERERAVLGAAIREGHCDLLPEAALPRMI
ncbi:MAG: ChaN family lipoprotein, partial [Myxococcota bacterium]|nr:ChaN family lipoprotein [Myxococcota bacterium]